MEAGKSNSMTTKQDMKICVLEADLNERDVARNALEDDLHEVKKNHANISKKLEDITNQLTELRRRELELVSENDGIFIKLIPFSLITFSSFHCSFIAWK